MKIALGSDHGGYELKEHIKKFLEEKNIEYVDYGTYTTESVDYPDFGHKVAKAIKQGECDRGIVCCGTGIGISISVNKVPGIRCALVSDCYSAKMSREHNDANVLALGGRVVGVNLALEIVDVWLKTEFQGGRHQRRVDKIKGIEEMYSRG
ncbi:ribose 5-phosphate isomerase B [Caloranaerobacter azorensis]|uniref:Ribose 5-phosphate isomerase B n=2 Tax=Caloranaerobacter azorensis TaxID=116090 RepID=A0A1M5SJ81_9FIRM|nr:ribose 5-phosphate isomerase B [Caloranaerobacter azorensis]QIB27678.1 ribose 5-phosphate isomerase B [Caloranaerobacter azorensis]SHH38460.1 ribose 5-phosphate isomerase B [Caloranaerobacter azorensis DSM 13643]